MCRPTALWWGTKKEPLKALSVIPLGLEPKTYCLEGSCSIQLSYGTVMEVKNTRFHFRLQN